MRVSWTAGSLALVLALLTGVAPARAQAPRPDVRVEGRMLREAASLEAQGDLEGAERVLLELIEAEPGSSSGVFALERVLRAQGQEERAIESVEAFLGLEPDASAMRFLQLRLLVEQGRYDAVESAVGDWTSADPDATEPWRELARIRDESVGPDGAVDALRNGVDAVDEPGILRVDLGGYLAAAGDLAGAAREWSRAIDEDPELVPSVQRRLDEAGADRPALVERFVVALGDAESPQALRTAARLGIENGMPEDRVRDLAERAIDGLGRTESRQLLMTLGQSAEAQGQPALALWAYDRARATVGDSREGRVLDDRIASAALAVGDTARAAEVLERVAESWPPRSSDRRASLAASIRLRVGLEDADAVIRRLDAFTREYPDAPESEELTADVASRLLARGERGRAEGLLDGLSGPAALLERGYLMLEGGDVDGAAEAFQDALPDLAPERATEVVQLVVLLSSLEGGARDLAADVALSRHRGDLAGAVDRIEAGVDLLRPEDRAAVLAQGAAVADEAGRSPAAEAFRRRILEAHPDAPEMPEAALRLARQLGQRPGSLAEATRILEGLILSHPQSPIVPDARRELGRLQNRGADGVGARLP